jgi:preprotein translocase subunit SecA
MDDLKQSVQNAVYEQKDPLLIYKFESFKLFQQVLESINKDILSFVFKGFIPMQNPEQVREAKPLPKADNTKLKATHADANAVPAQVAPIRQAHKHRAMQMTTCPNPKHSPCVPNKK